MPGRDGTGPWGYGPLTGGRRGPCAGGAGYPRGGEYPQGAGYPRGGGHGRRNQFRGGGLPGRPQAAQADAPVATPIVAEDSLAGVVAKLTEVLERLERVESAKRD